MSLYVLLRAFRFTVNGTDARLFEGCFDVTLTEEEIKYLEEPYQPTRIIGHQ